MTFPSMTFPSMTFPSMTRALAVTLIVGWTSSLTFAEPFMAFSDSVSFESQNKEIHFAADFPGGKIDGIEENGVDEFSIVIRPEAEPINDSAWYAFRVQSKTKRHIKVRIEYEGGSHRYKPKISRDRINWEPAENLVISRDPSLRQVTLKLPVSDRPVWVAGQELVSNQDAAKWIASLREHNFVSDRTIAKSVNGRPIYQMTIGNPEATDSIFLLSRQHPPEVTGTIGMMHFVEAICQDTKCAERFRNRFKTVVVPIANPDGVARGYWRSNANGIDLNRDWQHFTQPETEALRSQLVQLREQGRLWLFLDFHSTYNELFYTAPKENNLFPLGFTQEWLNAVDKRLPSFDVLRDDAHNAHRATSKAWVARELGIHAITYEFGDETNRERIKKIALGSAEEMMRLLLDRKMSLEDSK